jgi:adenylate cyclase
MDEEAAVEQQLRRLGRAVEAAGGRVDKFIGDGVMALFVSNGTQSGPRIGIEKGPLTGVGTGLSR